MTWVTRTCVVTALLGLCSLSHAEKNNYTQLQASNLAQCLDIGPKENQSGLLFNPDGYRSYYLRSRCIQDVAVKFRDPELCEDVKRRRSLFASSWGISPAQCTKLAGAGIDDDLAQLRASKRAYEDSHVELIDFTVARNGNRRDFDIVPVFGGSSSHAYTLTFAIVETGTTPIHTSGYYLDGKSDNIRIYVRAAEIRQRLPTFDLTADYQVAATLQYSIGYGNQVGRWSENFIETHFPEQQRTQTLVKTVRFGAATFTPVRQRKTDHVGHTINLPESSHSSGPIFGQYGCPVRLVDLSLLADPDIVLMSWGVVDAN